MTTPTRTTVTNPTAATLLSVVPWAAFLVALQLWPDDSDSSRGVAAFAPISFLFIALPSALPVVVARAWATRLLAVAAMTATNVVAASSLATSDDAQAGLAILLVPFVAAPLAVVIWVGQLVVERRPTAARALIGNEGSPASPTDRLAALVIDAAAATAVLVVPLTALSHAGQELVAAILGITAAASFLALPIARWGRTLGHSLLGLEVVDSATQSRVGLVRAYLRSVVVVVEVVLISTLLPLIDLVALVVGGRSLPDHLFRTSVVRTR